MAQKIRYARICEEKCLKAPKHYEAQLRMLRISITVIFENMQPLLSKGESNQTKPRTVYTRYCWHLFPFLRCICEKENVL